MRGGAVLGRVWEGGTPPAQLRGMEDRCKLPPSGLGAEPQRATLFCIERHQKKTAARRPFTD